MTARLVLLAAPLVFAAHVYEEYPGFIAWMNARVSAPLTHETFALVNGTAFLVTLVLSAATALAGGRGLALALVGWLSFLMLAQGAAVLLAGRSLLW